MHDTELIMDEFFLVLRLPQEFSFSKSSNPPSQRSNCPPLKDHPMREQNKQHHQVILVWLTECKNC